MVAWMERTSVVSFNGKVEIWQRILLRSPLEGVRLREVRLVSLLRRQ
jgi:hypothetical protein